MSGEKGNWFDVMREAGAHPEKADEVISDKLGGKPVEGIKRKEEEKPKAVVDRPKNWMADWEDKH